MSDEHPLENTIVFVYSVKHNVDRMLETYPDADEQDKSIRSFLHTQQYQLQQIYDNLKALKDANPDMKRPISSDEKETSSD